MILLAPFSWIYGAVVALRNKCYDWHIFRSTAFPLPVITVGNITVGGTGKTPHTELLVGLLRSAWQPAVLSRGYKRRTKGFRYVETTDTTAMVGDEPLQLKQKFPAVTVAVDANRTRGIRRLIVESGEWRVESGGKRTVAAAHSPLSTLHSPLVIVLDDAFQHRRVHPTLSLLLIDYHRPLHRDHLLPWGRLRDQRSQLRRADMVCITKCPAHLTPEQQQDIAKHLPPHLRRQLFFTTFEYGAPIPVGSRQSAVGSADATMNNTLPTAYCPLPTAHCLLPTAYCLLPTGNCLLLTGIANPAPLVQYLNEQGCPPVQHLVFRDHHAFTAADARRINATASRYPDAPVFTTEKDAVRLRETSGLSDEVKQRLYYLPVTVRFLADEEHMRFKDIITSKLKSEIRN